ncbi:MAG: DapH/DapD/GlmU-related protein [Methylophilus sp.]
MGWQIMVVFLKKVTRSIPSINYLLSVFGYFRYICKSATRERPVAAIVYVLSETFNLILGVCSAKLVGWSSSCLGRGARLVGTKAIYVGKNANIKRHAWIEAVFAYNQQTFIPSIKIGERFFASDRLHISAINRIEIGDDCLFGSGVYISDHNHGAYKSNEQSLPTEPPIARKLISLGPVIIGSNVWLGDNVVIVGPITIGNGVVVGANSVVTQDIPDNIIACGVPAKILKSFNVDSECWEKVSRKIDSEG